MPQPPLLWPPLETIRQSLYPVIPEIVTADGAENAVSQNGLSATAFSPVIRNHPEPYAPLQEYALRQQRFEAQRFAPGLLAGRLVSVEFPGYSLVCLLDAPEEKNRWRCFVVSPECDWAGRYDVLLEPEDGPLHPICGMVQTWHSVILDVDPQARILGELSAQRMAAIRAVHDEYNHAPPTPGDSEAPQPGMIALRALGSHTVLTGSVLAADDLRLRYQALYRDHVQGLIQAQEVTRAAQNPAVKTPFLSNWIQKGRSWFSADWLIRPAFAVLCLFFVGQMLMPANTAPENDIRFRGGAQGKTLTVYWRQEASSQAITQILREAKASIVYGPDPQKGYVLQSTDTADLSAKLQASGLVEKIECAVD